MYNIYFKELDPHLWKIDHLLGWESHVQIPLLCLYADCSTAVLMAATGQHSLARRLETRRKKKLCSIQQN